ncbi:hypothetical protein LCGC14_1511780 [marine sediment metagenome]|uniref:Uncharacterized protein n=1 Tax=marine sediment metagenome TaxID=412755 RepID=A0A0F9JLX7_9ZZZZ
MIYRPTKAIFEDFIPHNQQHRQVKSELMQRIADLEKSRDGYYGEAAKGWGKFRKAEVRITELETENKRLKVRKETAELEGEIPRNIVEEIAEIVEVETEQWTGKVQSAVKKLKEALKSHDPFVSDEVWTSLKRAKELQTTAKIGFGDATDLLQFLEGCRSSLLSEKETS